MDSTLQEELSETAPVSIQPSASLQNPLEVTFPFPVCGLIEDEALCQSISILITQNLLFVRQAQERNVQRQTCNKRRGITERRETSICVNGPKIRIKFLIDQIALFQLKEAIPFVKSATLAYKWIANSFFFFYLILSVIV